MREQGTGEDYITRTFMIFILIKYYSGGQIKKNEIGVACDTYGREGKCIQSFGGETLRKETISKT
jgi:hypothetical protein